MPYRIVYRAVIRCGAGWLPKIAYIEDGKPAVLEGDPECPYNTRHEAMAALPELEAILLDRITGAGDLDAPPPLA